MCFDYSETNNCKEEGALRERSPPPMPKFQPKVIWDLNPGFCINSDPDWMQLPCWIKSFRQV